MPGCRECCQQGKREAVAERIDREPGEQRAAEAADEKPSANQLKLIARSAAVPIRPTVWFRPTW
jgi:hypothetical protein